MASSLRILACALSLATIGLVEWSFAVNGLLFTGNALPITLNTIFGIGGLVAAAGIWRPSWRQRGAVIIGLAVILAVELVRLPAILSGPLMSVLVAVVVLKLGFLALLIAAAVPASRFVTGLLTRLGAGILAIAYTTFLVLNVSLASPPLFAIANVIDLVAAVALLAAGAGLELRTDASAPDTEPVHAVAA